MGWDLLGGDPAPGWPGLFEELAQSLGSAVEYLESAGPQLVLTANHPGLQAWSGQAADRYFSAVHPLAGDASALLDSHSAAVRALRSYAEALSSLQAQARSALASAETAAVDKQSAQERRSSASARLVAAQERYLFHKARVEALEAEKMLADTAGHISVSASIANQIYAAQANRDAACSQRAQAISDQRAAESASASAEDRLSAARTAARLIREERHDAARGLAMVLSGIDGVAVTRRSWIDHIRADVSGTARVWAHGFQGDEERSSAAAKATIAESVAGVRAHEAGLRRAGTAGKWLSDNFGFAFTAAASYLPKVGKSVTPLGYADQGARMAQNVYDFAHAGHGARLTREQLHTERANAAQGLFDTGTGAVAGWLMGKKTLPSVLAGTDIIVADHVERAYRAIDWTYTFHHLRQLNPFAPGAMKAVWGAEKTGLWSLGQDWFGSFAGGVAGK